MSAGLCRLPQSSSSRSVLLPRHDEWRGGREESARRRGEQNNNNNDEINKNGTIKGREQMHQKASGPQRGLPVSKVASLGSSAIGTDHTSQAFCFVGVFFWGFFVLFVFILV